MRCTTANFNMACGLGPYCSGVSPSFSCIPAGCVLDLDMSKPTWRSRNPDKYRACQAATMRRRRAAAKQLKAVPSVAAVEQQAVTTALQECEDRAVGPELALPEVTLHPGDTGQASESMTLHQWLAMTPDARRAWVQENRPGLKDDVAVQRWVTGLRP